MNSYFISTSTFGSFKKPLETNHLHSYTRAHTHTHTHTLTQDFLETQDLACSYIRKCSRFLWLDCSTSSWKRQIWIRLDLIFKKFRITITKFRINSRSTHPDLRYLPMEHRFEEQEIKKNVLITTWIIKRFVMKRKIPPWVWRKVDGNWNNMVVRINLWTEGHCRTNTRVKR